MKSVILIRIERINTIVNYLFNYFIHINLYSVKFNLTESKKNSKKDIKFYDFDVKIKKN